MKAHDGEIVPEGAGVNVLRGDRRVAVIVCGALGAALRRAAGSYGASVEIHCLPAVLHNRPSEIPLAVERLASELLERGCAVAVAYADCGTYGALDAVCERLGLRRLAGLHCYDLIGGPDLVGGLLEEVPGTYLLTDFLLKGFSRLVSEPLGLDRHPELVSDYFGHYARLVWLTEAPTANLEAKAAAVAEALSLPLEVVPAGGARIETALVDLLAAAGTPGEGLRAGDAPLEPAS
ncbi:MAG: DUF1638 domain-containing protein [Acidimicrobiales bacterium]